MVVVIVLADTVFVFKMLGDTVPMLRQISFKLVDIIRMDNVIPQVR